MTETTPPPTAGPATSTTATAAEQTSPELAFAVVGARAIPLAAVPGLGLRLSITRTGGGPVQSVLLATAIQIAPARRGHDQADRRLLTELFGAPEQWARTMRPLPWTRTAVVVPPFAERTVVELALPCPSDVELAVVKYLTATPGGDIPLDLMFSGTVFHTGPDGRLRTAQIPWSCEAAFELPVALWRRATGSGQAGSRWLRLGPDAADLLAAYRSRHAHSGWDQAVLALLGQAESGGTP